jgi:Leucine-rich repeat (LRR) protein
LGGGDLTNGGVGGIDGPTGGGVGVITDPDQDLDGVPDLLDNCPNTPPSLSESVNLEGCPNVLLQVTPLVQPDGLPALDSSIVTDESYSLYCFEGLCEGYFYSQGDTVTLTTSQGLGQYVASEWVGVTCAQGNINQSDCTFVVGEPDINGVVSLSVNLVTNPNYVNQPPELSSGLFIDVLSETSSSSFTYPYDLENDPVTLALDPLDSVLGTFQLTEEFPGSYRVTFTSTSPTETGVVSTVLRVTDGNGYDAVPVVGIVNPSDATAPTPDGSSLVFTEAELTGYLALQLPPYSENTTGGVGPLEYAVYSATPQATFTPDDATTGLFSFQANEGFSGNVPFVYVVTDTATGAAVAGTGSVLVRGSTGGVAINCPGATQAVGVAGDSTPVCQLPQQIDADLTLTNEFYYLISDEVVVGNGHGEIQSDGSVDLTAVTGITASPVPLSIVTLSIQRGTTIFADTSDPYQEVTVFGSTGVMSGLTVTRGSQILATGTELEPIRFVATNPSGQANWRGITLQGFGEHRDCPDSLSLCNIVDIDGYGFAGGYQANDSSGILTNVVIADAGAGVAEDSGRKNALTLMSVGSGTQISHIQIVESAGDGIEIRGGSVNIDHLLVEDSVGDALYYEQGYLGQIQYAALVQGPPSQGVALKGRTSTLSATPDRISSPLLSNITMVGDGASSSIAQLSDLGGLYLTNSVFTVTDQFSQANTCVDLTGDVIDFFGDISIPSVFFGVEKALFDCAFTGTGSETSSNLGFSFSQSVDVTLAPDTYAVTNALGFDSNTVFSSTTLGSRVINSAFFTPTSFVGAVDPAAIEPWWAPWVLDIDAPRFQPPVLDSDLDGISDSYDAFPLDIAASQDVDLDGLPDSWNPGFSAADSTSVPALVLDTGVDSDGDGLVDGLDPYPQDPTNPTGTCPSFSSPVSDLVCALPQLIDHDLYLTNSVTWLIAGNTTVGNGNLNLVDAQTVVDSQGVPAPLVRAILTIQEGTELQFANGFDGFSVTRGSAINAIGSEQNPIIVVGNGNNSFVLQGYAPAGTCNTAGCNFTGIGGGAFGGDDPSDASGSLRYVLFENIAEFPQSGGPTLSLMGVGAGTELSHIVIDGSGSRGLYISGGAAHIDHLGITGTFGDSLSWNDGYKGSMQFVVIDMGEQQQGDGIFAASNGVDPFANTVLDAQRSVPTLANVTIYNGAAGDWVAYNIANSGLLVFDSVIMRGSISAEPFESCGIGIAGPNVQGLGTWLLAERIIADCQGGPGVGYFSDSGNLPPAANIISTEALLDTRLASLATEATLAQAPDWTTRLGTLTHAASASNFDSVLYLGAVDPSSGVPAWWSFALPSDAVDSDGDGIPDNEDLFPFDALEAADTDRDGIGNVADLDDDNDGVPDTADAFPFAAGLSVDNDQDGVAAVIDLDDNDATTGIGTWSEVIAQITDSALQLCLQDYAASLIMPSNIRTLECEGAVESLAGIDALKALEGLKVSAGAPIVISALENLPLLRGLDLSGNAFRDSTVFSGLSQVRHLYLEQNHLRDISGLAPLVGLRSLDLFGNYIQSADALSGLTSLGALNLAKNDLSDASGLAALVNLRKLNLSGNQLSDTSFVSGLTALESISMANNPLQFLEGFAGYEGLNLKDLDLTGAPVLSLWTSLDSIDQAACPNSGQEGVACPVNVYGIEFITCDERNAFLSGGIRINLVGSFCDVNDPDLDGIGSLNDAFPNDPAAAFDTDNDGLPDAFLPGKTVADSNSSPLLELDPDIDNDGVLNDQDAFPFFASESLDSDMDGVGDNGDFDPADPAISSAYILDALLNVSDSALRSCIETALSADPGGTFPDYGFGAPLDGEVALISLSESFSGSVDFANYVRPKVYTEQLLTLSCGSDEGQMGSMTLDGLEAFTYLETLAINSSGVSDITAIGSLKRLVDLDLYSNLIEDVSPLAPLTQLRSLVLWDNPVVDVSPLANMVLLEYLDLDYTRVDSVAALSGLSRLQEVYVTGGTLSSLQGAEGWVSLQTAWLYENKLTDISALAGLQMLERLDLGDNLIVDISPLANMTGLYRLYLSGNQINDVEAIAGLSNLERLRIARNRLRSLDAVSALPNLRYLDAPYNNLSSVPNLAGLTSLYDLDLSYNRIESLDGLSPPASLRFVDFESNAIQRINGFAQNYISSGGLNIDITVQDNPLSCTDVDAASSLTGVIVYWDFCDDDSDADGVVDLADAFPQNGAATTDSDGDGLPDVLLSATVSLIEDDDDDNDGVLDINDAFPLDPTEWQDSDGDGVGDNKDADPTDASVQFFSIDTALAGVQDAGFSACLGSLEQAPQTTDAITSLYCAEPITSLAGLDKFPYLERLQVVSGTGSGATDLSVLSSLPDLKTLGLSGDFADLAPLGNLAKLETLDLLFTEEASRDLSALGSLTALKSLYMQNVEASGWQFLANLTALEKLSLPDANIASLSELPLAAMTSLTNLNLSLNPLSSLSGLSGASGLAHLNVDQSQVSDLADLSGLSGLESLSIAGIPAQDFSALTNLLSLRSLHAPDTALTDLSVISGLSQLEKINIDRTGVSSLSALSTLANVTFMSAAGNHLTDLQGLENMTFMEGLVVPANAIATIDGISALGWLKFLNISNNQITSIAPLFDSFSEEGSYGLTYLFADHNQLSDVSILGSLYDLEFVSLNDNSIISLASLEGKSRLEYVSARNNQISIIPALLGSESEAGLLLDLTGNPIPCDTVDLFEPNFGMQFVFDSTCVDPTLFETVVVKTPVQASVSKEALNVALTNKQPSLSIFPGRHPSVNEAGSETLDSLVVESEGELLISLISSNGIEPLAKSVSLFWSGVINVVDDIRTDVVALVSGVIDSISDSKEVEEASAEHREVSISAVSSFEQPVHNEVLSPEIFGDAEGDFKPLAYQSYSRLPTEPVTSAVSSEKYLFDSPDRVSGGHAIPTWDLFADSFGVLQEDKFVLWVKPEPAGIQVLRAAQ